MEISTNNPMNTSGSMISQTDDQKRYLFAREVSIHDSMKTNR